MKKRIIIIGAGLSGLYAAHLLKEKYEITILEARDYVGGRIYNIDNLDMGPSWFWNINENFISLIKQFGLNYFPHYEEGYALYDAPNGVERFNAPKQNNSFHLEGGMVSLIQNLQLTLDGVDIQLNTPVVGLEEKSNEVIVYTESKEYIADYVISTLPPRLVAESIEFTPKLEENILKKMKNIPTWMGFSTKVLITYKNRFWRDENLSGLVMSHQGPLSEIHDISDNNQATLFGFCHLKANKENLKEKIKAQLVRLFGNKALEYTNIHIKDWTKEQYTSTQEDKKGLSMHPIYGLTYRAFSNKVEFIGTETSESYGGYLEGALLSAKKLLDRY